jgi:hypothetical protein
VKDFIATIGERGVMKTKVFGLALMLSLATMLGACDGGGGEPAGTKSSPAATTGGEPADTGATPAATTAPMATTSPEATTSPAATTAPMATTSPEATTSPAATPKKP